MTILLAWAQLAFGIAQPGVAAPPSAMLREIAPSEGGAAALIRDRLQSRTAGSAPSLGGMEEASSALPLGEVCRRLEPVLDQLVQRHVTMLVQDVDGVVAESGQPIGSAMKESLRGFKQGHADHHIVFLTDISRQNLTRRVLDHLGFTPTALPLSGAAYLRHILPAFTLSVVQSWVAELRTRGVRFREDPVRPLGEQGKQVVQPGESVIGLIIAFDKDWVREQTSATGADPRPRLTQELKGRLTSACHREGVDFDAITRLLETLHPSGEGSITWLSTKFRALQQWVADSDVRPVDTLYVDDLARNLQPFVSAWDGLVVNLDAYDPALAGSRSMVQIAYPGEPKPSNGVEINRLIIHLLRAMEQLGPDQVDALRHEPAKLEKPRVQRLLQQAGLWFPDAQRVDEILSRARAMFPDNDYGWAALLRGEGTIVPTTRYEGDWEYPALEFAVQRSVVEGGRYTPASDCLERAYWLAHQLQQAGIPARIVRLKTPLWDVDVGVVAEFDGARRALSLTPGISHRHPPAIGDPLERVDQAWAARAARIPIESALYPMAWIPLDELNSVLVEAGIQLHHQQHFSGGVLQPDDEITFVIEARLVRDGQPIYQTTATITKPARELAVLQAQLLEATTSHSPGDALLAMPGEVVNRGDVRLDAHVALSSAQRVAVHEILNQHTDLLYQLIAKLDPAWTARLAEAGARLPATGLEEGTPITVGAAPEIVRGWGELGTAQQSAVVESLAAHQVTVERYRALRDAVTQPEAHASSGVLAGFPPVIDAREGSSTRAELIARGQRPEALGKLGVVIAAAGEGSRLLGPSADAGLLPADAWSRYVKPTVPVMPVTGQSPLAVQLDILAAIRQASGVALPVVVVDSEANGGLVRQIVSQHDPAAQVVLQGANPIMDHDGLVVLRETGEVAYNPDGTGGVLQAALGPSQVTRFRGQLGEDARIVAIYGDMLLTDDLVYTVAGADPAVEMVGIGYPYPPDRGATGQHAYKLGTFVTVAREGRAATEIVEHAERGTIKGLAERVEELEREGQTVQANSGLYAFNVRRIADHLKALPDHVQRGKTTPGVAGPTDKVERFAPDVVVTYPPEQVQILSVESDPLTPVKDPEKLAFVRAYADRAEREKAAALGIAVAPEARIEIHPAVSERLVVGSDVRVEGPVGVYVMPDRVRIYTQPQPSKPWEPFHPEQFLDVLIVPMRQSLIIPTGTIFSSLGALSPEAWRAALRQPREQMAGRVVVLTPETALPGVIQGLAALQQEPGSVFVVALARNATDAEQIQRELHAAKLWIRLPVINVQDDYTGHLDAAIQYVQKQVGVSLTILRSLEDLREIGLFLGLPDTLSASWADWVRQQQQASVGLEASV